MIVISNRGNLWGPQKPDLENEPRHIEKVLQRYQVKVDIWETNGTLWLGSDGPQYRISKAFLLNGGVWVEINGNIVTSGSLWDKIHYFRKPEEGYNFTSKGYIWTTGNVYQSPYSIVFKPETYGIDKEDEYAGVCTDFPEQYSSP